MTAIKESNAANSTSMPQKTDRAKKANDGAPKILVSDSDRLARSIVVSCLGEKGYDCIEAANGQEALNSLEEYPVDLIVTEYDMPAVSGLDMVARVRSRGDQTPVILLSGSIGSAAVSRFLKHNIVDFLLKPVQVYELVAKVQKVIGPGRDTSNISPRSRTPLALDTVLIVDDSDRLLEKFRKSVPDSVLVETSNSAEWAEAACQESSFTHVIIDMVIPGVNSQELMNKLRESQPSAEFYALCLRTVQAPDDAANNAGFDGFLFKPFDRAQLLSILRSQQGPRYVLATKDNILRALPATEKSGEQKGYYQRLADLLGPAIEELASDGYEQALLDFQSLPSSGLLAAFIVNTVNAIQLLGVTPVIIGGTDVGLVLHQNAALSGVAFFPSVDEAVGANDG